MDNIDFTKLNIRKKEDGSFIIIHNYYDFHLTPEYACGEITHQLISDYITKGGEVMKYIEQSLEFDDKTIITNRIAEIETNIPKITAYITANLSEDDVAFNKEKLTNLMIEYEDLKYELDELKK